MRLFMHTHTHTQVAVKNERPPIPPETPRDLMLLIEHCWHPSPRSRPSFAELNGTLKQLADAAHCDLPAKTLPHATQQPPPSQGLAPGFSLSANINIGNIPMGNNNKGAALQALPPGNPVPPKRCSVCLCTYIHICTRTHITGNPKRCSVCAHTHTLTHTDTYSRGSRRAPSHADHSRMYTQKKNRYLQQGPSYPVTTSRVHQAWSDGRV